MELIALILAVLMAVKGAAVLIVNFTETPVDDKWVAKVYPWIEKVAGILGTKAKQRNRQEWLKP
jgi:hypothetical protein